MFFLTHCNSASSFHFWNTQEFGDMKLGLQDTQYKERVTRKPWRSLARKVYSQRSGESATCSLFMATPALADGSNILHSPSPIFHWSSACFQAGKYNVSLHHCLLSASTSEPVETASDSPIVSIPSDLRLLFALPSRLLPPASCIFFELPECMKERGRRHMRMLHTICRLFPSRLRLPPRLALFLALWFVSLMSRLT